MKSQSMTIALLLGAAGIAVAGCAPVTSGNAQGGLVIGVYSNGLPANAGQASRVADAACATYGKTAKLAPSNHSNGVTISYSCVTPPVTPLGMAPNASPSRGS